MKTNFYFFFLMTFTDFKVCAVIWRMNVKWHCIVEGIILHVTHNQKKISSVLQMSELINVRLLQYVNCFLEDSIHGFP